MSMQVSYKKQLILFIMLVVVFLVAVEAIVNVWLYYFYRCEFEENEIFEHVDKNIKRQLCLENIGLDLSKHDITKINGTGIGGGPAEGGVFRRDLVYINNEGFRSPDFSLKKPENTYRIFTVGGSTTFSGGVMDNQTWPFYLQQLYDKTNLGFKVEVINTGWPKYWSVIESNLIKDRLVNFDPDLFVVYDGWNEVLNRIPGNKEKSATQWKETWMEICNLGEQYGYATIITLQPMIYTGNKILTEQEYKTYNNPFREKFLSFYEPYAEQLQVLDNHCAETADLRNMFDMYPEPIFFDEGHVGPRGNQILAENMYQLSLPVVMKGSDNISGFDSDQKAFVKDIKMDLLVHV